MKANDGATVPILTALVLGIVGPQMRPQQRQNAPEENQPPNRPMIRSLGRSG
jgi:hypothetical protein